MVVAFRHLYQICDPVKVKIAYNYWDPWFYVCDPVWEGYQMLIDNKWQVMTNEKCQYGMWDYKGYPGAFNGYGEEYSEVYAHVILSTFFSQNNLSPVWIYANGTWGWQDEESGLWNGAVGKVGYLLLFIQYNCHNLI